jgi:cytochrome c oxidase subunit 2
MSRTSIILTVAAVAALSACGGNAGGVDLSPAAQAGRNTMRSNGCASCHGANGQGGVGPSFEGLFGSAVTLEDGSTVIADADYLRESITDPSKQIVEGYTLPMPTNDLSDAEIDEIIAFIVELEGVAP